MSVQLGQTTAGLTFVAVNATVGMRVSEAVEDDGLDASEHGAPKGVMDPVFDFKNPSQPPVLPPAPAVMAPPYPMMPRYF